MDLGRLLEQRAVDVARLGIQSARWPRTRTVQPREELTEIVGARSLRSLDELIDDAREEMAFELSEILGEEAPDRLQEEVATDVRARGEAVTELVIKPGHKADRLSGHRLL